MDESFWKKSHPKFGIDFFLENIKDFNNELIKCHIWNMSGQERFRLMILNYYKDAFGGILCLSCLDSFSFSQLEIHLNQWKRFSDSNSVVILVFKKIDVIDKRVISTYHGNAFAQ